MNITSKKKYKSGIYIGKFFPMHLGHISVIYTLESLCESVQILFYHDEMAEKRLASELGRDYAIDMRISDAQKIFDKNRNIEIKKLDIPSGVTFPTDRLKVKDLVKKIAGNNIDLQIFGSAERELCAVNKCAENFMLASMYEIESINNEIVELHSTLVRNNYGFYKKYLCSDVRRTIDNLSIKNHR